MQQIIISVKFYAVNLTHSKPEVHSGGFKTPIAVDRSPLDLKYIVLQSHPHDGIERSCSVNLSWHYVSAPDVSSVCS